MSQRQDNEDRMRRAESWYERSLRVETDDERFIFLWIAFNAAYGRDPNGLSNDEIAPGSKRPRKGERERIFTFLGAVLERDKRNRIRTILQERLDDRLRTLLGNPFVFCPFWRWIWDDRGDSTGVGWTTNFRQKNAEAWKNWESGDVHRFLTEVLERLYTLRNQVFHGGVTYRAGKGREQIRDGADTMAALVKATLNIMKADIKRDPDSEAWKDVAYPTVSVKPELIIRRGP